MMIRIGRNGGKISKLFNRYLLKKFNLYRVQHTADLYKEKIYIIGGYFDKILTDI